MFEHSEGDTDGLGWFEGPSKTVLPNQTDAGEAVSKVLPHMGWNTVRQAVHPLFQTLGRTVFLFCSAIILHRKQRLFERR